MEKPSVSVTFQDVPESETPSPRASVRGPPKPFRNRAFTTGSLWEILSRARSSPTHGTGRGWIWGSHPFQEGSLQLDSNAKLITDYVHMERKNRRRHWSEFDAGGSRQKEGSSVSTQMSSATGVTSSEGFLKPNIEAGGIPKPHEVQMRLDHKITTSKSNPNRNSLLANTCISTSLQCLFTSSKRRAQSAPVESDELSDFSDYQESFVPYWRASPMSLSKGMSYLGESVRSISKCRKSSVNSTGSGDDEGAFRDGCLTPSGTFNVSSGSSISVPSYRIVFLGPIGENNADLLETFTALGDADDDDVFVGEFIDLL